MTVVHKEFEFGPYRYNRKSTVHCQNLQFSFDFKIVTRINHSHTYIISLKLEGVKINLIQHTLLNFIEHRSYV